MIRVHAASLVDRGFGPCSDQTKDYNEMYFCIPPYAHITKE